MEKVLGLKPLSGENEERFNEIWNWFVSKGITTKERPQVASEAGSYHLHGLIGINEAHNEERFPLAAVMLEETLHYILSSDDKRTSADFSPQFLHGILKIITGQMSEALDVEEERKSEVEKRKFQSMLILRLWKIIERQIAHPVVREQGKK